MAPQSGNKGELWVPLLRQRQARQMPGGFKRKSKTRHLSHHLWWPNRNRTTGGLKQKAPFPSWNVLHRDSWGGCKEGTSSAGVRKSSAGDVRKPERTRGPLCPLQPPPGFIISWPRRTPLPLDPPLCWRPASVLQGRTLPYSCWGGLGFYSCGHLVSLLRGPTTPMSFGGLPQVHTAPRLAPGEHMTHAWPLRAHLQIGDKSLLPLGW